MTTLCYAKKTCSIGIHVLMEEVGLPYDLKIVDFSKGEQKTPEYKALNPKGKVAALVRDDGSVLTEYAAIAMWLAMTNPEKKLAPTDPEGLARTIEAMDFIVGTVHMLSWRLFRRPDAYPVITKFRWDIVDFLSPSLLGNIFSVIFLAV